MISIDKLKPKNIPHYVVILIFFSAFIIPGYGYLHVVDREFLYSLNATSLILTSVFYSLPLLLLCFLEELLTENRKIKGYEIIAIAGIKSVILSYVSLFTLKIVPQIIGGINFLSNFYYFYGFHVSVILIWIIGYKLGSWKRKKKVTKVSQKIKVAKKT